MEFEKIFRSLRLNKYLVIIFLILIGVIFLLFKEHKSQTMVLDQFKGLEGYSMVNTEEIESISQSENPLEMAVIYVEILGAVKQPGVYCLDQGSRVIDLVNKAGGLMPDAYQRSINQALILEDQVSIYVYRLDEIDNESLEIDNNTASMGNPIQTESNTGKININEADLIELQELVGIGPAKAQAILDYRQNNGSFQTIEEVQEVKGIGNKTFDNIKGLIRVQ